MKRFLFILIASFFTITSCSLMNEESKAGAGEITQLLNHQQECWNNGDVDCFMQSYWNNDSMLFVSGDKVSYGWQKVRDNYKKNYSSKEKMGELTFDIISLEGLSSESYFMVGSWHLSRVSGDIGGKFSLLWKKINGEWKIVADHTS